MITAARMFFNAFRKERKVLGKENAAYFGRQQSGCVSSHCL